MSRRTEQNNLEATMDIDDEDEEWLDEEWLAVELHRYVQFRLTNMVNHPGAYGRTREAVILQLMLIAEFALLTHPEAAPGSEASFEDLILMFPDATVNPQRVPTNSWIRECANATGAFIAMKIMAVQLAHQAECPHCGPSDRMTN